MSDYSYIDTVVKFLRNIAIKVALEGASHLEDKDFELWAEEISDIVERGKNTVGVKTVAKATETSVTPCAKNFTLSIPNITVNLFYKGEK